MVCTPTASSDFTLGIDEVGCGSIAGPVVAAAVVLHHETVIDGLADSKAVSAVRRATLVPLITASAVGYAIAWVWPRTIEARNILGATLLAMQRAYTAVTARLDVVPPAIIDGIHCPPVSGACRAVPGADRTEPAVMAASILAKESRDAWMRRIATRYPGYDFARNVGYPTPAHLDALAQRGACALHRRNFAPVTRVLSHDTTADRPVHPPPGV